MQGVFKQILFQHDNPVAIEFLQQLQQNESLYDGNHEDYNKIPNRKRLLANWMPIFKQKFNIDFNINELSQNIQVLQRYYRRCVDKDIKDPNVLRFLQQCSFLPTELSKLYKCEHCMRCFKCGDKYAAHLFNEHGVGDKDPLICEICQMRLASSKGLKNHIRINHQEQEKINCPHCHRKFGNRENLERHLKNHDEDEIAKRKRYICKTCGTALSTPYHLATHEKKHANKRDFICHLCPKAFFTNGHLQDHLNTHLGIRKHKCEQCGKGFHSSHALSRHRQTHEQIRRYICKLCDTRFHQFVGLSSHLKKRHNAVPNDQVNYTRIPKHEAYQHKDILNDSKELTKEDADEGEMQDVEMLEDEFDI